MVNIMLNENMFENAQSLIDSVSPSKPSNVKVIRKETGLIERKEDNKIIIAEDNRQVLFG